MNFSRRAKPKKSFSPHSKLGGENPPCTALDTSAVGPGTDRYAQIPYEQTKAINQWRSIGKSPFSDECLMQLTPEERYDDMGNLLIEDETRGVYLDCTYEEDIAMASAQRRCYKTSQSC